MAEEQGSRNNGVQVVARIADILRTLEDEPDGLSLSQIASRSELARSTVQRLVGALVAEGFLSPVSPRGRVRLGATLARLGAASRRDLQDSLIDMMQELGEKIDETIDLAVLEGSHIRVIDQVPSDQPLRAVSAPGEQLPLHSNAGGKALLSTLPEQEVKRLLPPRLPAHTPQTITSRAILMRQLAEIRRTGIAIVRDEHTRGISGIAGIAYDLDQTPISLGIPVPSVRFDNDEKALTRALLETCKQATKILSGPRSNGAQ